jgi:competence protein ComEA
MIKKLQLVGFSICITLIITGLVLLVSRPPHGSPVILLPTETPGDITIYINGAVNHPGVYTLPHGSRLQDGILAAGGLTSDANNTALNLAEVLSDEGFIHVLKNGEVIQSATSLPSDYTGSSKGIITSVRQVDINHATLEEIMTLPGIGPTKANAIILYRTTTGLFQKADDLLLVNGIGPSTLEQIKDWILILP